MNKLSNQPPKGTSDWLPEEFAVRKYIFDTWRKVCTSFGYQEYLTPIVESAEIYRAKSGEDVGGKELMSFFDRGDRELSIRPEMTPSVTRMVTKIYDAVPKPLRLFSIANFFRNEKPQRGRNREFWQLNFDVFGSDSISADVETLQIALEIMLSFNPPKDSFVVNINNRKLIEAVINDVSEVDTEKKSEVVRILDKWEKLPEDALTQKLALVGLKDPQIELLKNFMKSSTSGELLKNIPELENNLGFIETKEIEDRLKSLGYGEWIRFAPNVIRGFDYYDGMVFEVFDKNPENSRSMFGGGRYNGLASLFGSKSFPAVGCAPGDETTKLFLEAWNLVPKDLAPEKYYLPLLSENLTKMTSDLTQKLRREGKNVISALEVSRLGKAMEYADKSNIKYVVILGEEEMEREIYKLKDMVSGEEKEMRL